MTGEKVGGVRSRNMPIDKVGTGRVSFHGVFSGVNSQQTNPFEVSQFLPVDRGSTVRQLDRIKRNLCNLVKDLDAVEIRKESDMAASLRYSSPEPTKNLFHDH